MKATKKITKQIIDLLNDRAGFDSWWDNIDEECKKDIKEEINDVLESYME